MVTRLDIWLVENKKARSRERAKEMIISGGIRVNGKTAAKPSYSVCDGDTIEVNASELKYVGRGGLKLEKALNTAGLYEADIEIVLDGKKHKVKCQDVQFHPVSDAPIHVDFLRK